MLYTALQLQQYSPLTSRRQSWQQHEGTPPARQHVLANCTHYVPANCTCLQNARACKLLGTAAECWPPTQFETCVCFAGCAGGSEAPAAAPAADAGLAVSSLRTPSASGSKVTDAAAAAAVIPADVGSVEDALTSELYVSSANMKRFQSVCLPESTDSTATRTAAAKALGIDPVPKATADLFARTPEPNTCAPSLR